MTDPTAAPDSGDVRAVRNLEQLRREDAVRWARTVSIRRLDRILASAKPGTSLYEAAFNERNALPRWES